ncbi:MAG: SUMF1/EgtB/PvdO family nonheme iron enzyme, partial [Myxococcota bacterium]|nr:SUMF1/EgtB/PvdO family nonheme iron enzyme [Myxococcota bacterium]
ARAYLEEGRVLLQRYRGLRQRLIATSDERLILTWQLDLYAPPEEKRRLWSTEATIEGLRLDASRVYSEASQQLASAATFDPNWSEVKEALAELYSLRLEDAEQRGDQELILYCREMLRHYDDSRGLFQEQLNRQGRLQLQSDQPALVSCAQFIEVDLCLKALKEEHLGYTPLQSEQLPEGGWLIRFQAEGFRDTIASLWLRRGEMNDLKVRFFSEEELGDFIYIPAGPAWIGAGPRGREGQEMILPDYLIGARPVSAGAYLLFLNTLAETSPAEARKHAPRKEGGDALLWEQDERGFFTLPIGENGENRTRPVHGISFDDATRYCQWYTLHYRRPVRLPTESEWEKAGRGAEGRSYPWGERFDVSFCCHSIARERRYPEPPELHPIDQSIYGVFGLAGGVQEFCDTPPSKSSEARLLKGGGFQSADPLMCRLTHREAAIRDRAYWRAGFRLVSSLKR